MTQIARILQKHVEKFRVKIGNYENEKKLRLIFDPINLPFNGIIFLNATWSGPSQGYLKSLISILENYPQLDLFVYDIDKGESLGFMEKYHIISHGVGETFWVLNGEILFQVLNYKDQQDKVSEYSKSLISKLW